MDYPLRTQVPAETGQVQGVSVIALVVLPGAVRERARVGAGPDHGDVDAVRLPAGVGRAPAWPRAPGRVLRGGAGLPVGVVPAAA